MSQQIILQDISIYGSENAGGGLVEHQQDKAIGNALVNWFTAKAGDIIYRPDLAGVLDKQLFKVMTPERLGDIQNFLRDEITNNFDAVLTLNSVNVTADKQNRIMYISVAYTSKLTNTDQLVNFASKQTSRKDAMVTQVDVPYINDNLLNFVLIKKPDLPGIPLVKDDITGIWLWGPYRLTNLQDTNYNFEAIFDIASSD